MAGDGGFGWVGLSYEMKFGGLLMEREREGRLWLWNAIHFNGGKTPQENERTNVSF